MISCMIRSMPTLWGFTVIMQLSLRQDVRQIQGNRFRDGFVAVKENSVVAWGFGHEMLHGEFSGQGTLNGQVQISRNSWAAVGKTGQLHAELGAWRLPKEHEIFTTLPDVTDAECLQSCDCGGYAALRKDGTVVTFGEKRCRPGEDVQAQLKGVRRIQSTVGAFAALRGDGTVVTWGCKSSGGCSEHVQRQLRDVKEIQSSESAFAALRSDGTVVTWGNKHSGGESSNVQAQLTHVKCIQSSLRAFAALRSDGSVVTWGSSSFGGCSRLVREQLGRSEEAY